MRSNREKSKHVTASTFLVLVALLISTDAGAWFMYEDAPRTANYFLRTDEVFVDNYDILHKWDLLIMGYRLLDNYPEAIAAIEEANPDQIRLVYIDPFSVPDSHPGEPGDLEYDFLEDIYGMWYAYNDQTPPVIISVWPLSYHVNYTEVCPDYPAGSGYIYQDYFMDFVKDRLYPLIEDGIIDGIFLDEMSAGGYVWWNDQFAGNFDYNLDSVADNLQYQVYPWLTGAILTIGNELGDCVPPGGIVIGNNCAPHVEGLQGKFYEGFPAPWEGGLYTTLMDMDVWNSREHGINGLTVNGIYEWESAGGSPDDMPPFRYRFTGSLLSDCYFNYDFTTNDHYQLEWYELFDFNLGKPIGDRYSIGETAILDNRFEGSLGSSISLLSTTSATITSEPGLVLEGEQSVIIETTQDGHYPGLFSIQIPGGYQPETDYTISFKFRILDSEIAENALFCKFYHSSDKFESERVHVSPGASGQFRATFPKDDPYDYVLYLQAEENLSLVFDSLTVVEGERGLLARNYEHGVVVCNGASYPPNGSQPSSSQIEYPLLSDAPRTLPFNPDWQLVDGDGQFEDFGEWLTEGAITLAHNDGVVFSTNETAIVNDPVLAAPCVKLGQPWPNPGNPTLNLRLSGRDNESAQLSLYDVGGRFVVTLWEGRLSTVGETMSFRPGSDGLPELSSGVYLIRASAGGQSSVKRWVLLR
ncbi:MAG: T9SS type A sorting domain-containing protein [bacterium]|nr:T9SS type A sorting domain-containing protein [bacterium]